jgi:hypothetical protein
MQKETKRHTDKANIDNKVQVPNGQRGHEEIQ